MSSSSRPPQAGRSAAMALFQREAAARQAVDELHARGIRNGDIRVMGPSSAETAQIRPLLRGLAVPEGESRFYGSEMEENQRTLVVVDAGEEYASAREVLLRHGGYDVQSRGGALAAASDAGVPGGTGPQPIDLTSRWEDVRSRYEMLWQQHYGTSDIAWDQAEPVSRFAWEMANDARWRGRPWSEAEEGVRRAWESSSRSAWSDVREQMHDVWEDVAEEAATGSEGGADRRIPRPGTDQSVPARDLAPPGGPPG